MLLAKQPPNPATHEAKDVAGATSSPPDNASPRGEDSDEAIVPSAPTPTTAGTVAPLVGASRLSQAEIEAILRYKKRHPSMGPAQIGAQFERFHGWRVAVRAIARVFVAKGYKLEHRGSRPEGYETPHRFEAPYRNALWQLDFAELFISSERRQVLIIEDDFSRFIVGHRLVQHPTSEVAVEVLREAIRRHGRLEAA